MKSLLLINFFLVYCLFAHAQDYNWIKKLPNKPDLLLNPMFSTDEDGNYVRFDQAGFYGREKLYFEIFDAAGANKKSVFVDQRAMVKQNLMKKGLFNDFLLFQGKRILFNHELSMKEAKNTLYANFFDKNFQATSFKELTVYDFKEYKEINIPMGAMEYTYGGFDISVSPDQQHLLVVTSAMYCEYPKMTTRATKDFEKTIISVYDKNLNLEYTTTCTFPVKRDQIEQLKFSMLMNGELYGYLKYTVEDKIKLGSDNDIFREKYTMVKYDKVKKEFLSLDIAIDNYFMSGMELINVDNKTLTFFGGISTQGTVGRRTKSGSILSKQETQFAHQEFNTIETDLVGCYSLVIDKENFKILSKKTNLFSRDFNKKLNALNDQKKARGLSKVDSTLMNYKILNMIQQEDGSYYLVMEYQIVVCSQSSTGANGSTSCSQYSVYPLDMVVCKYDLQKGIVWDVVIPDEKSENPKSKTGTSVTVALNDTLYIVCRQGNSNQMCPQIISVNPAGETKNKSFTCPETSVYFKSGHIDESNNLLILPATGTYGKLIVKF